MTQTKFQSLIESLANIIIGYIVGVLAQLLVFPLYGIHVTVGQDFQIAMFFTITSLVRSYLLRRFFNRYHNKV